MRIIFYVNIPLHCYMIAKIGAGTQSSLISTKYVSNSYAAARPDSLFSVWCWRTTEKCDKSGHLL